MFCVFCLEHQNLPMYERYKHGSVIIEGYSVCVPHFHECLMYLEMNPRPSQGMYLFVKAVQ